MKYNVAKDVTDYMNSVASMGCNMLIDKPTRVVSTGGSCIDHVYTNLACEDVDNLIIMSDVSDHFGTFSKIRSVSVNKTFPEVYYRKSNLTESEWSDFNAELGQSFQHIPTETISYHTNVDTIARTITSSYKTFNR